MTKTVSITVPAELFKRLEDLRRERGGEERSKIIQRALSYYLELQGPDSRVVRRWQAAYARVAAQEQQSAESWRTAQARSLGQP